MLITGKAILEEANKEHYAVPAMNVSNLETIQAIISAAEEENSPVILQTTDSAINYAGLENISMLMKLAAQKTKVPVCIHLDHGKTFEMAKECIESGYTSVMIDGSHLSYEDNIRITKQVVAFARKKKVSVEAEIGTIGGAEDNVSSKNIILTDPKQAAEFVKKTGIDSLAVAVGTSHGAYKFSAKPKLAIDRIKEIKDLTKIPLVLHGSSGLPEWIIDVARKYGAKIGNPVGVPNTEIRLAIHAGINKVNIDTDTRLAFTAGVREFLQTRPSEFDIRKMLEHAKHFMKENARHKMMLMGSSNK